MNKENYPKNDIRQIINKKFKVMKRPPVIQEAGINNNKISIFINGHGGMQFHDGIRLLICAGFKIIDDHGNIVLGNPENRADELLDNTLNADTI